LKVQFDFSAADLAEVAERSSNRSRTVRAWRMQGYAVSAGVLAIVAYVLVDGPQAIRIGVAACVALALCFFMPRIGGPSSHRARLLEYFREQLGGDGPFTCEVELSPAALITRQMGTESTHPWAQVMSVAEIAEGIEFVYRPMGGLLVRNRAFADARACLEFLTLARRLVSKGVSADARPR